MRYFEIQSGIRLLVASDQRPDRIQFSAGTKEAASGSLQNYAPGAMLARPPWRSPSKAEQDLLLSSETLADSGNSIGVARIPAQLVEAFDELRQRARSCSGADQVQLHLRSAACERGKAGIIAYLREHFEKSGEVDIAGGIHVNSPGMASTTIDPRSRALVGLHVDSWYQKPLDLRDRSPNRVAVNLGSEDRFFLYLNLPISHLNRIVPATRSEGPARTATAAARTFMRQYPEYPVIRLRLSPGEAYIAPTENMTHDGSSDYMSAFDITLSLRGFFRPVLSQPRVG
jgi:hypothetical protein